MTKREFLARLEAELRRGEVADAAEIMEEYAQHFAFKLADGYTQEEICARLGDPGELGRQFARPSEERPSGLKRALARTGVGLAGALGGLLATLLMVFGAVLALTAAAIAAAGICLIGRLNPAGLLPWLPRAAAVILGVSLLGAGALLAGVCIYYAAFLRQLIRFFGRRIRNALAMANAAAALPDVPLSPQLSSRTNRHVRRLVLGSLTVFAALLIAGMAVCALEAGAFEFWHAWGWFGYTRA